jgi:TPP-dependent pyruvate/acetoin dehydrogenase alpha subunit
MAGRADRVTACFFGEGAVAEGEFHESMNLASLWQLPVVFCCENNLYAMGTALDRSEAETDLAIKASSYNMASWACDGMDVEAVEHATRQATTTVRAGGGPVFVEFRTYRFRAHSMYDPELYRSKDEVNTWKQHDPIDLLTGRLRADDSIDDGALAALIAEVEQTVDNAVTFADAGTLEPVDDLTRFVYGEAVR